MAFRVVRINFLLIELKPGFNCWLDRISYHKRPDSGHFLTRAYVHFSSFCFIALSQLGALFSNRLACPTNIKFKNMQCWEFSSSPKSTRRATGISPIQLRGGMRVLRQRLQAAWGWPVVFSVCHSLSVSSSRAPGDLIDSGWM